MAAACARHAVAIPFAPALLLDNGAVVSRSKDGFGSDMDEIRFECHFLPHFNPDTNANADLIGYEYKTDSSNLDTFSI